MRIQRSTTGFSLVAALLLGFAAMAWTAPTQDQARQVDGELRALLNPLLGEDAYRLSVTSPGDGNALRVVLILDSARAAASEQNREALSALVTAGTGLDAGRGDVLLVSALPFEPHESRWQPQWNGDRVLYFSLALLALALLLKLTLRLVRAVSAGGWQVLIPWRRQQAAPDYQRELMNVRGIALDDPARVAQVLRQWINSNE